MEKEYKSLNSFEKALPVVAALVIIFGTLLIYRGKGKSREAVNLPYYSYSLDEVSDGVYTGKTYLFNQSGVDVTINPFASSLTETGVENIVTFIEDSGYTIGVLKSMLYVLAASEPGTFYFGAIRETDRTVSPEVKVFNECVTFFPYFDNDGGFECAVFMNGRELTLENFCMYYSDSFVYLTRVKSSENFFPQ